MYTISFPGLKDFLNNKLSKKDIFGIYGEKGSGKTLFLMSLLLNLTMENDSKMYYITQEKTLDVKKKLISAIKKISLNDLNDLNNKSDKFIEKAFLILQKNEKKINNIEIIRLKEKNLVLLGILKKKKLESNSVIFFDNLDLLLNEFPTTGRRFLDLMQKRFNKSPIIFTYKIPIINDWVDKCSINMAIRDSFNQNLKIDILKNSIINLNLRNDFTAINYAPIYSLLDIKFHFKKKCTCGAIQTYGKEAENISSYHYEWCELHKLL